MRELEWNRPLLTMALTNDADISKQASLFAKKKQYYDNINTYKMLTIQWQATRRKSFHQAGRL